MVSPLVNGKLYEMESLAEALLRNVAWLQKRSLGIADYRKEQRPFQPKLKVFFFPLSLSVTRSPISCLRKSFGQVIN